MKRALRLSLVLVLLSVLGCSMASAQSGTLFSYSKYSFLNQTGSMPATTLFTPTVDSDYRVAIAFEFIGPCCDINDGSNVTPSLTWSDNTKSYGGFGSFGTYFARGSSSSSDAIIVPIHAKAGSPVQLAVQFGNGNSPYNDSYNVFVTVIGQ